LRKARDLPDLQNSFQLLLCRSNLDDTIESRFLCLQQDTMTFSSPPQAFPSTSPIRPGHKQTNNRLEIEDSNLNNCGNIFSLHMVGWGPGARSRFPLFPLSLKIDRQTCLPGSSRQNRVYLHKAAQTSLQPSSFDEYKYLLKISQASCSNQLAKTRFPSFLPVASFI
jgi:hypothetical protein